jgi:hypothetical protein
MPYVQTWTSSRFAPQAPSEIVEIGLQLFPVATVLGVKGANAFHDHAAVFVRVQAILHAPGGLRI